MEDMIPIDAFIFSSQRTGVFEMEESLKSGEVQYRCGVQYMKERYSNLHRAKMTKKLDFWKHHKKEGVS